MDDQGNKKSNGLEQELAYYKERYLEVKVMGDTVGDGVILTDTNVKIVDMNATFASWMCKNIESSIGKPLSVISQTIHNMCVTAIRHRIRVSEIIDLYDRKLIVTCNPYMIKTGELLHIIIVWRDMSELNRLRTELEQMEKDRLSAMEELEQLKLKMSSTRFIYKSREMLQVYEIIEQVAPTEATVLIEGETGTGKELISQEIFEKSMRNDKPFVKVNCAAIPENLLESELFGYTKGSFTGALNRDKMGLFESADNGTLLLDEIGEMPMNLQVKLLRAIQEHEFLKIGSTQPIKIDVRIIAATNKKLEALVNEGKFRQDLYYRLSVVPIKVPALRERKDDIPLLTNYFVDKFNKKYNKNKSINMSAIIMLEQYEWPGNVRELENAIERLVLFDNNSVISGTDVEKSLGSRDEKTYNFQIKERCGLKDHIYDYERHIIQNSLEKYGSTRKAAAALGITQATIMRKIKILGISNW
jgi:Transcriptional regulator containing PAS, AAA-type ATPase, and DNA-binding domains